MKNKIINLGLAFIIPFLIVISVLISLHMAPFGENTLAYSDANYQYINFFKLFSDVISGKINWTYSFRLGIGENIIGLLAYYTFHPYNILYRFFDIQNYGKVFAIIYSLIIGTCGVNAYIFFKELKGWNKYLLIFSTAYALIGFNAAYCFNTLFLTGSMIFPIVLLGIYRIVNNKKPYAYIISLVLAIFMNCYMGFLICIASILFYMAFSYINKPKDRIKNAIKYLKYSIISGLIPAFIWIPAFINIVKGRLNDSTSHPNLSFTENGSVLDIIAKLFTGVTNYDQLVHGLPNIFCGIITLYFALIFIIDKNFDNKKQIGYICLAVIYYLSFYITGLTAIFQGFTQTNWWPYRYSFVFSMILILMAVESFSKLKEIEEKTYKNSLIVLGVTGILVLSENYDFVNFSTISIDVIILAIALFAVKLYKKDNKYKREFVSLIVLLTCLSSYTYLYLALLGVNEWNTQSSNNRRYETTIKHERKLVDYIKETEKDSFYRLEQEYQRTEDFGNDGLMFEYNGIGGGSVTVNHKIRKILAKYGEHWNDLRLSYEKGMTSSMDAFFGIKYLTSERDLETEKDYKKLETIEGTSIYSNPFALKIGILADNKIKDLDISKITDVFEVQNKLWSSLYGKDIELYKEEKDIKFNGHNMNTMPQISLKDAQSAKEKNSSIYEIENEVEKTDDIYKEKYNTILELDYQPYIEYNFTAKEDGPVYLYVEYFLNREGIGTEDDILQYIGTYKKGDKITKRIYEQQYQMKDYNAKSYIDLISSVKVAYYNKELFENTVKDIQNRDITINKNENNDTIVYGNFKNNKEQYIVFTIPNDNGWNLYIDGEKTEIEELGNMFIGAKVEPGEHTYMLKYFPVGLKTGIVVTISALMLLAVNIILEERHEKI